MEEETREVLNITSEQLQRIMSAVVKAGREPDPIQAAAIEEKMQREKRKAILAAELGYSEDVRRFNRQNGCSHSRAKDTGMECAKGTGAWMTSGQLLTGGNAMVMCQRCTTQWIFTPSQPELEYIQSAGLLGFPPPAIERCVNKEEFLRVCPTKPVFHAAGV